MAVSPGFCCLWSLDGDPTGMKVGQLIARHLIPELLDPSEILPYLYRVFRGAPPPEPWTLVLEDGSVVENHVTTAASADGSEHWIWSSQDVSQREAARVAAERYEAWFEAAFQAPQRPMLILDAAGIVHDVNPDAETLLGPAGRLVGDPLEECLREGHEVHWACLDEARRGVPAQGRLTLEGGDGDPVTRVFGYVPSRRRGPVGYLALVATGHGLDTGGEGSPEARVEPAPLLLTAHDLANHLTPMKFDLQALRSSLGHERSDPANQALDRLESSLKIMERLLDRMGPGAQEGADPLPIQPEPTDLSGIVAHAIATFEPLAEAHSVEILDDVDPDLHAVVDEDRITQLLANLLDNAITYTPEGGRIVVRLTERADGIHLSVEDNGRGLRESETDHVFEPFYRAGGTQGDAPVHGQGLGLYICRRVVDAHGGTISCKSPGPGEGTIISVRLPAEPDG